MLDLASILLAEELPRIRHAEVLVPGGSLLAGPTLRELRFRQPFKTGPTAPCTTDGDG